jgi:shikimate dehydrogenase
MTRQFGIIGYPLTHSFSPAWFKKKFQEQQIDATYLPYALSAITDFPEWLKANPDIRGLSVTIPYKESIMAYLHDVDDSARAIGAVNCINIKDGILTGYNTDVIGFKQSLNPLLTPSHTRALVLGTGGSSKAVAWVLQQLGIPFTKVSRSPESRELGYDAITADIIKSCKVIINTTPLGQQPEP